MTDPQPQDPGPDPDRESDGDPALETAPERQTTPFLVLQFFIFPMAIVAVCVTVFVIFGLIAAEGRGARDYLGEIRSGSANRRWQAAFELSKVIQARKDPALSEPQFVEQVLSLFEDAARDDPRVRRYLALALGRLGDPRAVPALRKAIHDTAGPEGDSEVRIYSVWALGAIGDAAALPDLLALVENEDPGLRKTAVHALGAFASDQVRPALATALADSVDDVRWNAAVALARRGDAAAIPVLLQMMDRSSLARVEVRGSDVRNEVKTERLQPDQIDEAVLQAVTASAHLNDPSLRAALETLQASDPSLKVREAARAALVPEPRR